MGDRGDRGTGDLGACDALAAAIAIAAGSVAYGTPVRYENDGSFRWDENFLDVTRPARKQTGLAAGAGSFEHLITVDSTLPPIYYWYNAIRGLLPSSQVDAVPDNRWVYGGIDHHYPGEMIPNDGRLGWAQQRDFGYRSVATYISDWREGFGGAVKPHGYVGVRFDLADGTHYGWIELGVRHSGRQPVLDLTVLAWGYEAEPFTPIEAGAVPAPGALGALAFGAVAGLTRARREIDGGASA